jgi:hypothetical protein
MWAGRSPLRLHRRRGGPPGLGGSLGSTTTSRPNPHRTVPSGTVLSRGHASIEPRGHDASAPLHDGQHPGLGAGVGVERPTRRRRRRHHRPVGPRRRWPRVGPPGKRLKPGRTVTPTPASEDVAPDELPTAADDEPSSLRNLCGLGVSRAINVTDPWCGRSRSPSASRAPGRKDHPLGAVGSGRATDRHRRYDNPLAFRGLP